MRNAFLLIYLLNATGAAGCATQQQILDREISNDGLFEQLYGTSQIRVFYDPVAQQCLYYSSLAQGNGNGIGVGVGLSRFKCDPEALRKRAKTLARPNKK